MSRRYDVAVVGLGAMGSAAAAHAARRGAATIGLERFALGHDLGASGGRSRIIRKAYFESPHYVPLLERAYALWGGLERESGIPLVQRMGVLVAGNPDGATLRGVGESARTFGIPVEYLDTADLRKRFPQARILDGEAGILEPEAGAVFPERGIAAHLAIARRAGATLLGDTEVRTIERRGPDVVLHLAGGATVRAAHAVVCAGPWLASAFERFGFPVRVQRNVQFWFEPADRAAFFPDRLPAFLIERDGLPAALYGIPDLGEGVKAALHGDGAFVDPDALDREIHLDEIERMRGMLAQWLPGAAGRFVAGKACMYALTPDQHFIIGREPETGAIVAGGFSGHGYKFAPAIGELLAQLALDGGAPLDIGFLSPQRFR
jgi:sarcosine oxidase